MQRLLSLLASLTTRRPRTVVAAWVLLLAALLAASSGVSSKSGGEATIPGTGSAEAKALLERGFPDQGDGAGGPIVLHASTGTIPRSTADKVAAAVSDDPLVRRATPGQRATDGATQLISVDLTVGPGDLTQAQAQAILDVASEAAPRLQVEATGLIGQKIGREEQHRSERIGLTVAIVILLVVGGTVPAMLLPILTALAGLLTALALLKLAGAAVSLPTQATTLATMIGLGVGIDYSLFLLARIRALRATGAATPQAVRHALATTGSAVLFAASAVAIALCALAIADLSIVTKLGLSAAVAVVTAVLAALTLLPALAALLGDRVERLAVRRGGATDESQGWARWGAAVAARPWRALLVSLTVLLALAAPTLTLQLGSERPSDKPAGSTQRAASELIAEAFGPGTTGPLTVVAQLPSASTAAHTSQAKRLQSAVAKAPGVASVAPPRSSERGDIVALTVTPTSELGSEQTATLVDTLRATTLPGALPAGGRAYVGGAAAQPVDLAERIAAGLPQIIAAVVGLAIVLLVLAFRSIVLPLKAATMNLLSVGAAYGVLTLVFQHGWGATLIGLDGAVPIVSFVPMLMFAVLFGLSMDYEVFLLSRVQEHHLAGEDDTTAIVRGLASTGRLITAAAAIMVAVFASFLLDVDPTIKMFGLGLSAAIIIDATLVRCLLVPAAMVLMGRANWWIPRWLERRLPQLQLD